MVTVGEPDVVPVKLAVGTLKITTPLPPDPPCPEAEIGLAPEAPPPPPPVLAVPACPL